LANGLSALTTYVCLNISLTKYGNPFIATKSNIKCRRWLDGGCNGHTGFLSSFLNLADSDFLFLNKDSGKQQVSGLNMTHITGINEVCHYGAGLSAVVLS